MPARQNTGQLGTTLFRLHAKACAAYLAAILISALLMPTLLAACTPCFLNLWLTSPFADKPQMSVTAASKGCSIKHRLTSKFKSMPKVNVEGLPAHGLVPLHARGCNNKVGQILKFDAPVEGGDSQVAKRRLRTDAMVS